MSEILDKINALSDERQQIWRKLGRVGLMDAEFAKLTTRLSQLTTEIDRLWDQRRVEKAGPMMQITRYEMATAGATYGRIHKRAERVGDI
jgi:hypothetical protein